MWFSNLFFTTKHIWSEILQNPRTPWLLYGNFLPCIIIFQKHTRSDMKLRMGEESPWWPQADFFFMSANQMDSYYHLELLMSLVWETKPYASHSRVHCAQGWESLRVCWALANALQGILSITESKFLSLKGNVLLRKHYQWLIHLHCCKYTYIIVFTK